MWNQKATLARRVKCQVLVSSHGSGDGFQAGEAQAGEASPTGRRDPGQPWASELCFPRGPGNLGGDCFTLKFRNAVSEA